MVGAIESQVRHEVERAAEGHIPAIRAVRFALATGRYAAIGTARSEEAHEPSIPMTATTYGADGKPANAWRFSALNERGGLVPMVVASKLARPAVWAAFGGNRNIPLQRFRIDQPLTPPDKIYDYGTHGHAPNANAPEGCELYGHKDLLSAIKQRPRAEILGSADLVAITDPEELLVGMLPEDPEHVGFPRTVETELRVLIRGADFDTLGPISPYTYEPLAA